jgi:ankyrin repeat protein
VDAVDNAGKTPLHLAIEYKEDEVAEMLKGYQ